MPLFPGMAARHHPAAPAAPTEGELWTRAELERLRARRFTAPAWLDFMVASLRRARYTRARRRAVVRQSRRWGAAGLAAALPFGAAPTAWWALGWALLDWHVGMLETPGGEPRPLRAHDALTLARLWSAPVVRRHPEPWLVAAALVTDAVDGALARRAGPTRLGRDLDAAADTLFLDQALRGAIDRHRLSPRVLRMERARIAAGAAVALASYFGRSRPAPPVAGREPASALAAAGTLQAVRGRTRSAEALLSAAIGYRALIRERARTAPGWSAGAVPPTEADPRARSRESSS